MIRSARSASTARVVSGVCLRFALRNGDALISAQLLGIVCIFGWVAITTAIVWSVLKYTMGIRVSDEEEETGIDYAEIGIEAYPEFVSSP